jgi:general secretion pathway protein D
MIAVSAISPGMAMPTGIMASIACTAVVAVAQSPNLPSLPPPLPTQADGKMVTPADANATAKALLVKARAAFSEGKQEAAAQAFAQATLAAQQSPDMAAELQQTRQQFAERGLSSQMLDQAMRMAQPNNVLNSRAANALRNATPAGTALPPGLLSNNSGNTASPFPSTLPPATLPTANSGSAMPALATATPNASQPGPANPLRDQAIGLAAQAKMALDRGDATTARQLITQANSLRVPESAFAPGQLRPWEVSLEVDRAERLRGGSNVTTASALMPSGGLQNATAETPVTASAPAGQQPNSVQPGVYQPKSDASRVAPASGVLSSYDAESSGQELYQQGITALSAGNGDVALGHFKAAWQKRGDLDQATLVQLKDKLTLLQSKGRTSGEPEGIDALNAEGRESQLKKQKWFAEVTGEIADAERMAAANKPMEALDRLKALRQRVAQSDVDSTQRKNLLAMVDRVSTHMQAWVDENKSTIDLDQRNRQIADRISSEAATLAKTDAQVQTLVDTYNDLIDQGRYPEAELTAKKVAELKPNTEIAAVLTAKARVQRRIEEYEKIRALKAEKFEDGLMAVDESAIPTDDRIPLSFPSQKIWSELSDKRLRNKVDSKMSPQERKIRESLSEAVSVSFDKRPLADAMNTIAEMTGLTIIIDDRSIAEEGITVDQPISLDLRGNSIPLKSVLNNILNRLNLTYTVKDDVLTIESSRFRKNNVYPEVYNVKDLVIPIPNFVSDYNTGMAGALQSAYQAQTHMASATIEDPTTVANRIASVDPNSPILAQMNSVGGLGGMSPGLLASGLPGNLPNSSVGLGGGAIANYQSLIQLIENTISPDQWQSAGGTSSMREFRQNLSLVVTAPQETHEAIADLLKSLRALQNLQVTIEVRFIQLADTFFERIGIDFDFNINDKVRRLPGDEAGSSVAVGLSAGTGANGPQYTGDLDFQVRNTFGVIPAAGNPDAGVGTSVGLAILSDLELFFFLEAAQGNSRSNVLQAPKVTMFDGQFASINDFASRPFVISYEPVVGDFAVAQRPIVVVLNEGTQMNVQSVVSQDKRFVRLTLVPQFTRIESGDRQFTFQGRTSSRTGTSILNPTTNLPTTTRNNEEQIIEGTTVQQPTLGVTSVTTTVSVPDGGTILLGGIKRLREARTERGTPILSKIPYLNRLFKNNAIGRETNTLMMTVTPRIIIPEEEEEQLGVNIRQP